MNGGSLLLHTDRMIDGWCTGVRSAEGHLPHIEYRNTINWYWILSHGPVSEEKNGVNFPAQLHICFSVRPALEFGSQEA